MAAMALRCCDSKGGSSNQRASEARIFVGGESPFPPAVGKAAVNATHRTVVPDMLDYGI